MAKRKKRKENKKDTGYLIELKGMLLILISIIVSYLPIRSIDKNKYIEDIKAR